MTELSEKLRKTALVTEGDLGEMLLDAADELELNDASLDLRWRADRRAIKRWQEATGKRLTWPDHADLCIWLLEQLEQKKK